jgi:hypothetical protein
LQFWCGDYLLNYQKINGIDTVNFIFNIFTIK